MSGNLAASRTVRDNADLIDALQVAVEALKASMLSFLPPRRKDWEDVDQANYNDWSGRIRRYTRLRNRLLHIERRA